VSTAASAVDAPRMFPDSLGRLPHSARLLVIYDVITYTLRAWIPPDVHASSTAACMASSGPMREEPVDMQDQVSDVDDRADIHACPGLPSLPAEALAALPRPRMHVPHLTSTAAAGVPGPHSRGQRPVASSSPVHPALALAPAPSRAGQPCSRHPLPATDAPLVTQPRAAECPCTAMGADDSTPPDAHAADDSHHPRPACPPLPLEDLLSAISIRPINATNATGEPVDLMTSCSSDTSCDTATDSDLISECSHPSDWDLGPDPEDPEEHGAGTCGEDSSEAVCDGLCHERGPGRKGAGEPKVGTGRWYRYHRQCCIHEDSEVTVMEACYYMATLKSEHRVPDIVIDKICKLNHHVILPPRNMFPPSYHLLKAVAGAPTSASLASEVCDNCWTVFDDVVDDPSDHLATPTPPADAACSTCANPRYQETMSDARVPRRLVYNFGVQDTVMDLLTRPGMMSDILRDRREAWAEPHAFWGSPAGRALNAQCCGLFEPPPAAVEPDGIPPVVAVAFTLGVTSCTCAPCRRSLDCGRCT